MIGRGNASGMSGRGIIGNTSQMHQAAFNQSRQSVGPRNVFQNQQNFEASGSGMGSSQRVGQVPEGTEFSASDVQAWANANGTLVSNRPSSFVRPVVPGKLAPKKILQKRPLEAKLKQLESKNKQQRRSDLRLT